MENNTILSEQIKDLKRSVQNNINLFVNVKPLKDRWKQFFEDQLQLIHDILTISDILRMNRKLPFVIPTENGQIAIWLEDTTFTIEYSDKHYNRINGYTIAIYVHSIDVVFYKPTTETGYKTDREFFALNFHSLYKSNSYESYYDAWSCKNVADKIALFEEASNTFDLFTEYFNTFVEQFRDYVLGIEEKLKAVNS